MNVADLIRKRFGMVTRAQQNPLIVEAMIARLKILPNNPNRLAWIITNLSGNNVFIALDMGVGADHGILLTPNGGSATMIYEEDFEATCWEVFVVAAADNSDVFALETVIDRSVEGGV